jgi:hypothetical protein
MAGRRLLLFVVLLLVIGAIASATVPRDENTAVRETVPSQAAPTPAADIVRARLPGRRDVRARVGDVVRIEVRHDGQDVVQVVSLGLEEPVDPNIPAELVFDADRAGRFAVTLQEARKRIGTIDIRDAG